MNLHIMYSSSTQTPWLKVLSISIISAIFLFGLAAWFTAGNTPSGSKKIQVVAAENFWGSLAQQLGGNQVDVTSIVTDPNVDPHEYETNTVSARAFAGAQYVVLNGAGYDTWGSKMVTANPNSSRRVLSVADLLGKKEGDNPHFWYSPDYVFQVVHQISQDYQTLDPTHSGYYQEQKTIVMNSLNHYLQRIVSLKQQYSGTQIAATEDIVTYLVDAVDLNLISPPEFMQAVAEGNDPSAQSVAAFTDQLSVKQPRVLIYNQQTSTAVTTTIKKQAQALGIPVVGVTETIQPAGVTFQDWMNTQLDALHTALSSQIP